RPVRARNAGLFYRASKYASRNWKTLVAAAAGSIILLYAVGYGLIQGRRAQRRFEEERRLANSFLFEVHDAIATLPGSTPARELVATRAMESLDTLSREAGSDVALKREVAESYLRVGNVEAISVESNLGRTKEGLASLEKAVAIFREILRLQPSD